VCLKVAFFNFYQMEVAQIDIRKEFFLLFISVCLDHLLELKLTTLQAHLLSHSN
jgi:hypothetical protein